MDRPHRRHLHHFVLHSAGRPHLADPPCEGYFVACVLRFAAGVFLWLIYGILVKDLPLVLANSVTFVLVLSVLFLSIRYRETAGD